MSDTQDEEQPEVLEAILVREQVVSLFNDLQQGANVTHVQIRTRAPGRQPTSVTLEQAQQLLDEEHTQAIQIYYEFAGQSWCDTLIRTPTAVRLVRATVSYRG